MDSYDWLDKYIAGTIEHCNSRNIFEIYDILDIKVVKLNKDNILLQGFEALYQRNYFDEETVFIRDDLPYQYEKFVLAHELGHALLHTEIYTAAFNKNLLNKGKLEKQAHYFALRLLNIKIDDIDFEGYTIEQVSKALYVSEESLKYFV
ncbi:ImmA/IrrE family metallo-endopeptidase [Clostridium sp. Cult3]|uniref:ImmA/IrrE family metallo-endopeptidase n=1 Tax=Clostridium sp. Cult3 TaxID=2079004 RepID=UPI001F491732|nr:ImmA/IrrE family metallo-endopeptidase [Clostridium sp. Cult3]MCF6461458.1 PTS N-acetylglucosamine transporter subunit IIABC [Clostridium sp. Cult3]